MEWRITKGLVSYPEAISFMEKRVQEIQEGKSPSLVWLLEHPPLYTVGTGADPSFLGIPKSFPIYSSGRGGKITYHGPGQRVIYLMLSLKDYACDLRWYVRELEQWIIKTLDCFDLEGFLIPGHVGVWVKHPSFGAQSLEGGRKIAAIGIRVQKWVTLHGLSLNINPHLAYFHSISPCGLSGQWVTSLADLSCPVSPDQVDQAFYQSFPF